MLRHGAGIAAGLPRGCRQSALRPSHRRSADVAWFSSTTTFKAQALLSRCTHNGRPLPSIAHGRASAGLGARIAVRSPPLRTQWRAQSQGWRGGPSRPKRGTIDTNTLIGTLMAAHVLGYGAWQYYPWFMREHFTASYQSTIEGLRFYQLVTANVERDIVDMGFSLLMLLWFGMGGMGSYALGQLLGPRRFLTLYGGGAVISHLTQIGLNGYMAKNKSGHSMDQFAPSAGSHGADAALVMYAVAQNPYGVFRLYGIIPVPAMLIGAGYILLPYYQAYKGNTNTGTGRSIGGAVFGAGLFFATKGRWFRL